MTNFSDLHSDGVDLMDYSQLGSAFGNTWYVDSGSGSGGDGAGYGTTPDTPFLTLDYAVGAATASNGDVILLAPGHAETKAGAGSLFAVDQAGLRIIGLGKGADRPTFTFSDTAAVATVSSASTYMENLLFVCGIDSVVAPLTVSGPDCTFKDIEFRDAAATEFVRGLITTSTADRIVIDGLVYNGDLASGDACTTGIALVGVNGALIKNCRFNGIFSTACINMLTTLSNSVQIENCFFNNLGTAVTKDVAMNIAACIYEVKDCFDAVAGYRISGTQQVPVQWAGGQPLVVSKTSGTITVASQALFNFIGHIRVYGLSGYVSTAMQNSTVNISFSVQGSADTAATAIAAATDFDNHVQDSIWSITGDFSDSVLKTTDVGVLELFTTTNNHPTFVAWSPAITGVINLVGGHVNSGKLTAYLTWEPVSPGAYVKAA